jgi:hypothetical protein
MAALIAGAAGCSAIALLRRARTMAVPVVVGVAALLVVVLLHVTVDTPRVNSAYPTRETAARFAAILPPGAAVAYVDVKLSTALMFYLPRRSVRLPQIRAVADLPDRSWRHALIPHEEMLLVRKHCGLPPPLREETLAGGRYVLVNLDGVGPLCIKARPTVTDR